MFERNKGKIHLQTPLMYLIQDNVTVGQFFLEQELLNQNSICHVDDRCLLPPKRLQTDMVAHLRSYSAIQLLGDSNGKAGCGHSTWLTDSYLG
jgi:hypothetical protein